MALPHPLESLLLGNCVVGGVPGAGLGRDGVLLVAGDDRLQKMVVVLEV